MVTQYLYRNALGAVALVCLMATALPVVQADHPQTNARFDHKGGNEWWVEVSVAANDGAQINQVWARAESSPTWKELQLRSWGTWAASFHIPPGDRVQFQTGQPGGNSWVWLETSCFFTHPAGVEQCDGASQPLSATFRSPSGNEWWQQVYVDANRAVAVEVGFQTVHGDVWKPLTLRSWGAWAGSYHAPQGTMVKFAAVSGQERIESACYRWTDATRVECLPRQQFSQSSDTRFDHKGGNEWWTEVQVGGPQKPTRVMARDDGGTWVELSLRSWGNWAGSFRIEPGNEVQFRALVSDSWRESCWFSHPNGSTEAGLQVCAAA